MWLSIPLLLSSEKLLEAHLIVLETFSLHSKIIISRLSTRKEESENGRREDKYHPIPGGPLWGVPPEACAPFLWGMDPLLSVLLMRLWIPFQRRSASVIMSITPHEKPN